MAIKFVPEVQLGHIFQAITIVVTLGGGALGAYLSIQGEIANQAGRIAILEMQAKARGDLDSQWRDSVKNYMQDTSRSLVSIGRDITDLKVDLAKKSHSGGP